MLKGYNNMKKSSPNNRTPIRRVPVEKENQIGQKDSNEMKEDFSKRTVFGCSEKNGETPV